MLLVEGNGCEIMGVFFFLSDIYGDMLAYFSTRERRFKHKSCLLVNKAGWTTRWVESQ